MLMLETTSPSHKRTVTSYHTLGHRAARSAADFCICSLVRLLARSCAAIADQTREQYIERCMSLQGFYHSCRITNAGVSAAFAAAGLIILTEHHTMLLCTVSEHLHRQSLDTVTWYSIEHDAKKQAHTDNAEWQT